MSCQPDLDFLLGNANREFALIENSNYWLRSPPELDNLAHSELLGLGISDKIRT